MRIWRPETFQGSLRKKKYFEGWYFKQVTADARHACAVIPGISLGKSGSHAFIQFFDSRAGKAWYFRYPPSAFEPGTRPFSLRLGRSSFSLDNIELDLEEGGTRIRGALQFSDGRPWPVRLLSPGAMGWFGLVPAMECYHGVLSFDHAVSGAVDINGEKIDYAGGRGYCEKDWGRSMPSSWIWLQTNHFGETGVSLFGSIARIPWLGRFFTGFIVGLQLDGSVRRFATYTGARITSLAVDGPLVSIVLAGRRERLEIRAQRAEGVDLPAPRDGEMTARVNESLRSVIEVRLCDRKTGAAIWSGTGQNAGLELVGDVGELKAGLGMGSRERGRGN